MEEIDNDLKIKIEVCRKIGTILAEYVNKNLSSEIFIQALIVNLVSVMVASVEKQNYEELENVVCHHVRVLFKKAIEEIGGSEND